MIRWAQRSALHDLRPPLPERTARALARRGWTTDDVRAVRELCADRAPAVLDSVLRGDWPGGAPATVLAWLRVGGRPLLDALEDPELHARQVQGMRCWSGTYGELGPLAHGAGLTLPEAAHLLAAGRLTRPALEARLAAREQSAVLTSWSDTLR